MQIGGVGIGRVGSFITFIPIILISLVGFGLQCWILYKFYGARLKIRDELSAIKDALRERRPSH